MKSKTLEMPLDTKRQLASSSQLDFIFAVILTKSQELNFFHPCIFTKHKMKLIHHVQGSFKRG